MEMAKISLIPDLPGVYLMKDKAGNVIYVGKAKSLKKRIRSYLGSQVSGKTLAMMSIVADVEYRLAPTEARALLLEASLIQQYMPRYNVLLRDDKSFPFVKATNENFPRICIVRKRQADGARYFGRFTSANLLKEALKAIRKYFPYRTCNRFPKKACIYYRICLCHAPCIGKIDKDEYALIMKRLFLFLEGKTDDLLKELSREMIIKSKEQRFEEALKIRDQINVLGSMGRTMVGVSPRDELEDLKGMVKLDKLPLRIEAFDISNISGKQAVGSMVSFFKAMPDKSNYRKFRVKTIKQSNDYGMLAEVVRRRYQGVIAKNLSFPDMILVDGGRAHLLTAQKELLKLGLNIPLISIAKERENIYIKGKSRSIRLNADTPALNLIRRIRDEAHRFALRYHHLLRRKEIIGR